MFGASKSGKVAAAAPAATDPQFNYVTALFNGDGTNGAQNNTFLDSSTNNFTITRNGTPTQGSAAPFGNNWSNYFPSVGDYVSFTDTASFGTGNFTVECFVFPTASAHNIIMSSTTAANWDLLTYGNQIYWHENGGNLGGNGYGTVPQNQWVHLAASRTGGNLNLYINGTRVYSAANTFNYSASASRLVGPNGGSAAYYASNVRLIKGTGIYSGTTITVPTAPLTPITGTSLLTCQSTYFKDNSTNNFTLTTSGTPSVQRFSPFLNTASYSPSVNGGAMYFNGTSSYLTLVSSAFWTIPTGTTPLTVEAWVYPTATASGTIITEEYIGDPVSFTFSLGSAPGTYATNNKVWFGYYTGGGWGGAISSSILPINTWSHIAGVFTGSTINIYINGVLDGTPVSSTNWQTTASTTGYIGRSWDNASPTYFNGSISNLRVVKGTAVYTSNFTPSTTPLTAITNTQLLLSGTNAGIYDSAMITTVTTEGSAQISTTQKKYGTAALYFPSTTTDCLSAPVSPNYAFGTGAWTIECWTYTSITGNGCIVDTRSTSTSTTGVAVGVSNLVPYIIVNNTTVNFTSGVYVPNTWQYMTFQSTGTAVYCWINGVPNGSTTYSNNLTDKNLTIGNYINKPSASGFKGYIDDLRITKGYGRYTPTVSFTPPTAALPTS
jgi:hypothetical protein